MRVITTSGTVKLKFSVAPFAAEPTGGRKTTVNFLAVHRQEFRSTLYQPDNSCALALESAACTSVES
jgi:hypothetical protein